MLQKGVSPKSQTTLCLQAGRLLETTPRVRIFNNKNNSLDNNSSNYSNNCNNFLKSLLLPQGNFGNTLGTCFVFQNGMGCQRCPKRHHQNRVTLLGTFLDPKIIKSRFQRHPKTSSEICPEKVLLKGVILRSSTCLNGVRGLKNQGFDVFRKGLKNEPNRHPFWYHF